MFVQILNFEDHHRFTGAKTFGVFIKLCLNENFDK